MDTEREWCPLAFVNDRAHWHYRAEEIRALAEEITDMNLGKRCSGSLRITNASPEERKSGWLT